MIGNDLDTLPLKYSPILSLGLPPFIRILPLRTVTYFLSSCRPEYRLRNWFLACAHVGLVDVGGVGAWQRFMCFLRKSQHPLNTICPVSRRGVALWEPPNLRVPTLVGMAWTVPMGRRASYWPLSYWPSLR